MPEVVYGAMASHDIEAFGAVAPQRQPVKGRFVKVAGAMAMAMAITALIVLAGSPSDMDASAMQAEWSTNFVEPQRVALAQQMMRGNSALKSALFTKLQEEGEPAGEEGEPAAEEGAVEPAAEEGAEEGEPAAEEEAGATPLKEPGFVIATTDDSSPPPVTEGTTFHHIKNFAGTEQMMNNGEVAAQGAGADFQNGEVVGAGVHVAAALALVMA